MKWKIAISLFLVVLILLQVFGKSWIIISFKINQESIAKTLCVQKNVKNNSCHGCCQLKKRLAEKDKQEQKQLPRSLREKNTQITDYIQIELAGRTDLIYTREWQNDYYLNLLPSRFSDRIFRPPQV